MSQRIIDILEPIQIQKDYCEMFFLAASQGNRLRDPVSEQHAIGQFRKTIMLGEIGHLERHPARCGDVVENDYSPDDSARPVVDRRGGILNGGFTAVAADQDAIHSQSYRPILLDGYLRGVWSGLAGCTVYNFEDFG